VGRGWMGALSRVAVPGGAVDTWLWWWCSPGTAFTCTLVRRCSRTSWGSRCDWSIRMASCSANSSAALRASRRSASGVGGGGGDGLRAPFARAGVVVRSIPQTADEMGARGGSELLWAPALQPLGAMRARVQLVAPWWAAARGRVESRNCAGVRAGAGACVGGGTLGVASV
jgi:hypothetical protein